MTNTFALSDIDNINFQEARVDKDNCVIRGVTLITGGLQADGHDLYVDDTTVKQLHELAVARGKVPVTLEHTGGIKDVNGYLCNFRIQGNKLKGDWVLLQNHTETPVMLERAEKQPETFGMSVAFKGKGVVVNGKKCARAERLLSADCVKRQAANPDGMFSAEKVDIRKLSMNENNSANNVSLNDIMAALSDIRDRLDAQEAIQQQLVQHINNDVTGAYDYDDDGDDDVSYEELLEALNDASDEELAAFNEATGSNITREQIAAEVDAYNAAAQAEANDAGLAVAAAAGSNGSISGNESTDAALSALAKEVLALKAKINADEIALAAAEEKKQFDSVREKIETIINQRDMLVELSERVIAENEALRTAGVKGGVPAGADIEFQERHKGGSIIEFEVIANEKYNELIRSGVKDATAKSKAIDFAVKKAPVAYKLWREAGRTIEFVAQ